MMNKHIYVNFLNSILLYVLFFFIGCNEKKHSVISETDSSINTTHSENKDTIISHNKINQSAHENTLNKKIKIATAGCALEIIDSDFSNTIIDVIGISKIGMSALCKKPFTIKQVVVKSEVDYGAKDTIFLVTSGKSKIVLANLDKNIIGRIPSWKFAEINDDSFVIKNNIVVGMTKNNFLLRLKSRYTECDTIKITDEERMSLHTFLFKDDILKQIKLISGDE